MRNSMVTHLVFVVGLFKGAGASRLVDDIGDRFPDNEHFFGLVNVSSLCCGEKKNFAYCIP